LPSPHLRAVVRLDGAISIERLEEHLRRIGVSRPSVREGGASAASDARRPTSVVGPILHLISADADGEALLRATRALHPEIALLVLSHGPLPTPRLRELLLAGASEVVEVRELEGGTPIGLSALLKATEDASARWELHRIGEALEVARARTRQLEACLERLHQSFGGGLESPLEAVREPIAALHDAEVGSISEEAQEFLRIATGGCRQLGRIGRDLALLRRLEVGELELRSEWCSLDELLEQVVAIHRRRAFQSEAHLITIPSGLVVRTDAIRLTQIFTHLVDNALRSISEEGSIVLDARTGEDGVVVCTVSDDGQGIDPVEQERVFERFQKCGAEDPTLTPGPGLGLAICRGLVEALGGEITLRSSPGEGTCVCFELPLPVRAPGLLVPA